MKFPTKRDIFHSSNASTDNDDSKIERKPEEDNVKMSRSHLGFIKRSEIFNLINVIATNRNNNKV
ncbi:CLUMA_CG001284, isoform A [Clunio marinus]|uniref:CLUMA_CG001284, isoform A n=1 Tax=Clunio marinus TaxID=568069 RepID=A0A1J1HHW4_9DIPT|nr:CLUMA_CG001284, isoform A [Clunio marinus]